MFNCVFQRWNTLCWVNWMWWQRPSRYLGLVWLQSKWVNPWILILYLLLCITTHCAFCMLLSIVLSFPVSYTIWNNAAAKESGAAYCAAMMSGGRWQSVKCDHSHIMLPYICEKGIVVTCSAELLVVTSMIWCQNIQLLHFKMQGHTTAHCKQEQKFMLFLLQISHLLVLTCTPWSFLLFLHGNHLTFDTAPCPGQKYFTDIATLATEQVCNLFFSLCLYLSLDMLCIIFLCFSRMSQWLWMPQWELL